MRHQWIDALKGFGIILVIAMHSSIYCIFPTISILLTAGYMAMFFILSGYTAKKENITSGMAKKAKRLLIPYIFYGIIITSFFAILDLVYGYFNTREWIGLLYSRHSLYPLGTTTNVVLLSSRSISPLWFLTAMFFSFLWFYLYANIKKTASKVLCIIIYIIATIMLYYSPILLPWSLDTSFLCALFIITGYQFKEYAIKEYKKNLLYFLTLSAILAAYIALVSFNDNANLSIRIYGELGALSIILYYILSLLITIIYSEVLKLCNKNMLGRFLSFVGKHSLRIMCIHMPLITFSGWGLNRFGVFGIIMVFVTAFACSLGISVGIEKVCNRYSDKCSLLKYL